MWTLSCLQARVRKIYSVLSEQFVFVLNISGILSKWIIRFLFISHSTYSSNKAFVSLDVLISKLILSINPATVKKHEKLNNYLLRVEFLDSGEFFQLFLENQVLRREDSKQKTSEMNISVLKCENELEFRNFLAARTIGVQLLKIWSGIHSKITVEEDGQLFLTFMKALTWF